MTRVRLGQSTDSILIAYIALTLIDLDDFDGYGLLSLLNEDKSHNNIIVCVSYYQDATLRQRIKVFGEKLQGYSLVYKLEKHTGDWDKPYSCQIYIFVSSYYCYFRLDMFVWECFLAAF